MRDIIRKILKEEFYSSPQMDYGDNSVTFGFESMGSPKPKFGQRKVFFNKLKTLEGQFLSGENSEVILKGNGLELNIPAKEFRLTKKGDSGFVDLNVLKRIKNNIGDLLFNNISKGIITSQLIRKALKMAFESNWKEEDKIFSAGLRDIHTIGEKTGKGETWSIMNFFDTKKEVQKKIEQKWSKEGQGEELLEWLVDTFKNDEVFLRELIEIQWRSIKNGYETELYVSQKLSDNISGDKEFFPPGSKVDRYGSIDMIINGKSYQVKPLTYVKEMEKEGKKYYYVKTYGMKNYYKEKNIDYIAYGKRGGEVYVFPNKNYIVTNDGAVLHFESPQIY